MKRSEALSITVRPPPRPSRHNGRGGGVRSVVGRGQAPRRIRRSPMVLDRLPPHDIAAEESVVAALPTVVGVEYYAQIVARDATYRRLISAAGQIAQYAYEGGPDLDAVLNRAETLLMALRSGEAVRDFKHIR